MKLRRKEECKKELQKLKKGKIHKIENDRITLLNVDGNCEDIFPINPDFANEMRNNIEPNEHVFYVTEGDELIGIGLEEAAPEYLKILYDVMTKDKEYSFWPRKAGMQREADLIREVYDCPSEE